MYTYIHNSINTTHILNTDIKYKLQPIYPRYIATCRIVSCLHIINAASSLENPLHDEHTHTMTFGKIPTTFALFRE